MFDEQYHKDAEVFSGKLRKAKLPGFISFGAFTLPCKSGVRDTIQYNRSDMDLLNNKHEYTFSILQGELQVSLQLYENINDHYRLFCYTKCNNKAGMTFSVNLTTEKESDNVIYLSQKIKFAEQYDGSAEIAKAHRRQKQIVFCDLLKRMGFDISDDENVVLGIFDPIKKRFVNTTEEKFLNDFIVLSLLKGHFQGNKGYQLEILPSFNRLDYIFDSHTMKQELPGKLTKNKSKRHIPLSMRYKILKRDRFACVSCKSSSSDGVKLHVDHIHPFSLGGLTEYNNLQTLCIDCNLGKGNRHIG